MSPRTQEANEALSQERRAAILDAALGVFVERGFEGTRIQEIATRTGLSYGLVYHYFPTKEAIFGALVDVAMSAAGGLTATLSREASPDILGGFIATAVADPAPGYFLILVEALTKQGVPAEIAGRAREAILAIKAAFQALELFHGEERSAEAIISLLLGASILKVCGLSDGEFASEAGVAIASSGKGMA
jgi:Transcriptional regulator